MLLLNLLNFVVAVQAPVPECGDGAVDVQGVHVALDPPLRVRVLLLAPGQEEPNVAGDARGQGLEAWQEDHPGSDLRQPHRSEGRGGASGGGRAGDARGDADIAYQSVHTAEMSQHS